MALNDFSVFMGDGTSEFVMPEPNNPTWAQAVVGNNWNKKPILSLYATVRWEWNHPLHITERAAILARRNATTGSIRFRTRWTDRSMIVCTGIIDELPGTGWLDDSWANVTIEFWSVVAV